ncbi:MULTISPECIES: three-Cys-motif partner protein TcmP [unclassified Coleofasciculus]|uniref:three-Cys-motif partner protein TcmP n=1 Tax=unclassified Coleofasciculus TaxID=2692782 RepID=UPI0018800855|nr:MULTISPECIES: three-Cys-motif partner protein TcmP [unclassified Coleofasciculus]MBE9126354.1 three-Cys-motif partner protein TcmP [Coleofasciculus sp. LEGE 07081]MBE9150007.1 three-Cys-motif partner protein TcmP [Coleofasciculus sp. LEGE 07092]
MNKNETFWSGDGSYLPKIKPHTKAKHRILADYLERYLVTLCGNNRGKRKTLTFVDGFCGGGMYRDPDNNDQLCEGSPLIMIKTLQKALNIIRTEKSKPNYEINEKFIFIDSNEEHIACLKNQIAKVGLEDYLHNLDICEFIVGEFENCINRYIDETRKRKGSSFFFLDPFGYSDVSMQSIRSIISLGKSEIIYTYMIEDIIRHLYERNNLYGNIYNNILETEGYYNFSSCLDGFAKQKYIRDETYRLFRERGQVPYIYAFALMPNRTQPKYYLMHLASNPPAQREIKYTLWNNNTLDLVYQFEYDIYGLGFRTPDYYENNLSVIDIVQENKIKCRDNLRKSLMPIIYEMPDGIPLIELHNSTMQMNPATLDDYIKMINEEVSEGEINILRNGKITPAKNLKADDLIVKAKFKQLHLFS